MFERREQKKVIRFFHRSGDQHLKSRPYPDKEPGTDTLPQIAHIVILMMENHSYDSYLGKLAGRGEGLGATVPENDGVPSHHLTETKQLPGQPTQSWFATHLQWNNGACDGFVRSVVTTNPKLTGEIAMGYWTEAELPFYYGLARTFPLADHWFSSCLGPTFPNRRFLIAGTANGLIDDLPFKMIDRPPAGTIFDLLTRNGISWVNYHHVSNTKVKLTRLLGRPGLALARRLKLFVSGFFPVLLKSTQGNMQMTADIYPLDMLGCIRHLRSIDEFWADARDGTLPAVSIVDPDFNQTSEENAQDIQDGEGFAARVINAVMNGKAWEKTLLVWTYDEHGGYYDHVSPPAAPAPDDVKGRSATDRGSLFRWLLMHTKFGKLIVQADTGDRSYDRYGFRVPAVVVSPFAKPDHVTSTAFDHTSILKLIERKWNLPALTDRDDQANDPLEMLDLDGAPAFLTPPTLPAPAKPWTE